MDPELLRILACPADQCHGRLNEEGDRLVCEKCGLRYPMHRGWPELIPEEADPPADPANEKPN